jgi:hypothetical protein
VARRSVGHGLVTAQPYFVALVSGRLGTGGPGASIRDARTGAATDLVTPPPDAVMFTDVTSAGGGLFYLTGQGIIGPAGAGPRPVYRMQVDDTGRAGELVQLPGGLLPPGCHVTACPGGKVLAYVSNDFSVPGRTRTAEAGLVDLASGARRPAHLPAGCLTDLSWAADIRTAAFTWQPESAEPPTVYVTDTGAADGDWVSAGQPVEATRGLPDQLIEPLVSADGGEVYCTVAQPDPRGGLHWNRMLAIPVGGGPPRVLFQLRYRADSYNTHYMWTTTCRDATGRYLLAFATGYVYRVEVPSATFTRLPFPEGRPYAAAW